MSLVVESAAESSTEATAAPTVSIFSSCASPLAGGWITERLTSAQRSVFSGGALIIIGNALLASASNTRVLFIALLVTMLGIGQLKLNISAVVCRLYPEYGSPRVAGAWTPVVILALVTAVHTGLGLNGALPLDANAIGVATTWLFAALALGYFGCLLLFAGLQGAGPERVYVMLAFG